MGRKVQSLPGVEEKLRQQIKDFIQAAQPAWAKLVPAGRAEALPFMPEPARQCFVEAGLGTSPPSDAVVSWWDDLAAASRGRIADYLAQVGRAGERCSIKFEEGRVRQRPKWQAIESNRSGFDLLSIASASDPRELQIEVKASERPISSGAFHVTRHEWEVATNAERYVFHVWSLKDSANRLAILSPKEVQTHVPIEQGDGRWEIVEIPLQSFSTAFTTCLPCCRLP